LNRQRSKTIKVLSRSRTTWLGVLPVSRDRLIKGDGQEASIEGLGLWPQLLTTVGREDLKGSRPKLEPISPHEARLDDFARAYCLQSRQLPRTQPIAFRGRVDALVEQLGDAVT
jgi:hypothetical protein